MSNVDELFDAPNEPRGNKRLFGLLTTYVTPVHLKSGASYTIPGVMKQDFDTKDESVRVFAGKEKLSVSDAKTRAHIVMVLTRETKEGTTYQQVKDWMKFDDAWTQRTEPSFKKLFGAPLSVPLGINSGVGVFVALDEVETGEKFDGRNGTEVNKTTWVAVGTYPTGAALKAAADEYFAKFGDTSTNGNLAQTDFPPVEYADDYLRGIAAYQTQSQKEELKAELNAAGKGKLGKARDTALKAYALEYITADEVAIDAHLGDLRKLAI